MKRSVDVVYPDGDLNDVSLQNIVDSLSKVGDYWAKVDKRRVYFDGLADLYGLKLKFYNSGNICWASLDGSEISNTRARAILARLSGKIWYDVNERRFISYDITDDDADYIIEEILKRAGLPPIPTS